jgi:hypothetical protein
LFEEVFAADPAWRLMARRIAPLGLLSLEDEGLRSAVIGSGGPRG